MSILALARNFNGNPNLVTMITDDSLATITTTGYLITPSIMADIEALQNGEFQWETTDIILIKYSTTTGFFTHDASANTFIELTFSSGGAGVVLPTVKNHIAYFNDTAGTITSNPQSGITHAGNIEAGLDGTSGWLASYPAGAGEGKVIIIADNMGAANNLLISNTAFGQSSTIRIPDPGNAQGRFLVGATATPFTNGHLIMANGTGGVVENSSIPATSVQLSSNIKARIINVGGSGVGPFAVPLTGLVPSSIVVATVQISTNPVSILSTVAGTDDFTITLSADPGATCDLNVVAFITLQ